MENVKKFSGENDNDLWAQVSRDMAREDTILEYSAVLEQQGTTIFFDLDIDLGGGFESGFETTRFTTLVPEQNSLRFHIYPQDWVKEIEKLFGLEDAKLGYPELDAAYIIQTNQPVILKQILIDSAIQNVLLKYPKAHLKLSPNEDQPEGSLKFSVYFYQAITNPTDLQEIYRLVFILLQRLENTDGYKRV
ncbi:hypothetical protein [Adhaeribacter soli]|uniref:Uncharacterized protein n=1 Tax=Adhaeribacter soli TaxID=2607655 RepID=A0A5N1J7X1_9BACT|nr:hypothetical protein [Adhaeribacter soli]KAA9340910.1 hypothetical protein F0P94_05650 [Adhaeribacter soli]